MQPTKLLEVPIPDAPARAAAPIDGHAESTPVAPKVRACPIGDVLQWLCVLVGLPLAIVVGIPIACANWAVFRSPSKIFFSQKRTGRNGIEFSILKFRTMREPRGSEIESWASAGDQVRVTRLGRLLRNSHLDELPQLINVLRGEMRLIGPRPEMVEIEAWATEAIERFDDRLALSPGITGYAQVVQGYTGRSLEAYAEKRDLALAYQEYRSLRLDLWILWRTTLTMLRLEGWSWNERLSGTLTERAAQGRLIRHPLVEQFELSQRV